MHHGSNNELHEYRIHSLIEQGVSFAGWAGLGCARCSRNNESRHLPASLYRINCGFTRDRIGAWYSILLCMIRRSF
eukprot:scaffold5936_cov268-Chaetoceros_neogracile.AAC.14